MWTGGGGVGGGGGSGVGGWGLGTGRGTGGPRRPAGDGTLVRIKPRW